MEIGVLYLSHAMLVLAELIVCSTRGFACILSKWFWPTVMSLSLRYGSPEASCNKRADTYFGRRINPIRPGLLSCSPGPGGGLRGLDAKNQGTIN